MSIPEAAVEAAAAGMAGAAYGLWELVPEPLRRLYLRDASLALEAAAPQLLAESWDEGMEAMYATTSSEWPPIPESNPYRSQS